MTEFDKAFQHVIMAEGGYSNDAHDPGGETKYGISKRAFPNVDIANLTIAQAKELYHKHYWEPCRCDELPYPLNFYVFDAAVNQGTGIAIKLLQRAGKLVEDGKIGPRTLAAAAKPDMPHLYMAERAIRYNNTGGAEYYLRGWLKRIFKLAREA